MTWAEVTVVASAAFAIAFGVLAHWAARTACDAAEQVAAAYQEWDEARHERNEWDRRSLACMLEINAAMQQDRPVADWAWAWANGIDEDD